MKAKYKVNVNFFKKWNTKIAYVLGFTFADGNIHGRTLAWDICDKELLTKINKVMKSNYPIKKRKASFRLRMSNPILLEDLKRAGLIENKNKRGKFPNIPNLFLRDFVRGFLDGDGWIIVNTEKNEICLGFSAGNFEFLKGLVRKLNENLSLTTSNIRKKLKKGKESTTYQIEYYSTNAFNVIKYLYDDLKYDDLFLQRKFLKQLAARKVYEEKRRGTKKWRGIEYKFGLSMIDLLRKLLLEEKMNGVQIAKKLNIHSSSVYRWLEKTKVRIPNRRSK